MDKEEQLFCDIAEKLGKKNKSVSLGKMMSAPGIVYKKKVFAFYYKQEMGFRAGRDFNPGTLKIKEWKYLNPYKNKPPMIDWFILPYSEHKKWGAVAGRAMQNLIGEAAGNNFRKRKTAIKIPNSAKKSKS